MHPPLSVEALPHLPRQRPLTPRLRFGTLFGKSLFCPLKPGRELAVGLDLKLSLVMPTGPTGDQCARGALIRDQGLRHLRPLSRRAARSSTRVPSISFRVMRPPWNRVTGESRSGRPRRRGKGENRRGRTLQGGSGNVAIKPQIRQRTGSPARFSSARTCQIHNTVRAPPRCNSLRNELRPRRLIADGNIRVSNTCSTIMNWQISAETGVLKARPRVSTLGRLLSG